MRSEWQTIGVGIIGLFSGLILIILVLTVISLYCVKRIRDNISKTLAILNILTMLCAFVGSVLDFWHNYLDLIHDINWNDTNDYSIRTIMVVGDIFSFGSFIFFYITLHQRLYIIFHNTEYQKCRSWNIIFYVLIILSIVAITLYCYICAFESEWKFAEYLVNGVTFADLAITVLLLILFIINSKSMFKKLHTDIETSITLTYTGTQTDDTLSENLVQNIQTQSYKLKFIVIRQILLSITAILFSQLFLICLILFFSLQKKYPFYMGNISVFVYGLRTLDGFVISLTLWLSFSFNVIIYKRLCGSCHKCCDKICLLMK